MCGLFFMQLSSSFRASRAILTDLSFLTVITTVDTKQSSSIVSNFSKCPDLISRSSSFFKVVGFCSCFLLYWVASGFHLYFFSALCIVWLVQNSLL